MQVWLVYELGSYFQNYRRYVRSLDAMAMHSGPTATPAAACDPFAFVANATAAPFAGGITPCGQIANSFFNDTYQVTARLPGGEIRELFLDVSRPGVKGGCCWPLAAYRGVKGGAPRESRETRQTTVRRRGTSESTGPGSSSQAQRRSGAA